MKQSELQNQLLVGVKVKCVREMTKKEMENEGWEGWHRTSAPTVIEFTNGILVYPSQDPEGNGPGALFGYDRALKQAFAFSATREE